MPVEYAEPAGGALAGALVLDPGRARPVFLLDLQANKQRLLPGERVVLPSDTWQSISPDRFHLAYTSDYGERLRIVASDGSESPVPHWPQARAWEVISWLDDTRLALADTRIRDGTVFVYEHAGGTLDVLGPFFPAESPAGRILWKPDGTTPVAYYDRSLSRVVIQRLYDRQPTYVAYELWDVPSKTMLWQAQALSINHGMPTWSPDGRHFAVPFLPYLGTPPDRSDNCAVLYLIDADGNDNQLESCGSEFVSWSPDGRYLATWRGRPTGCPLGDFGAELAVVEIESNEETLYSMCSPRTGFASELGTLGQYPVWSPDSRFVAFNTAGEDEYAYPVPAGLVILDTLDGRAWIQHLPATVLGWMALRE